MTVLDGPAKAITIRNNPINIAAEFFICPNAELIRPPNGDRFELPVLTERSEGGTSDCEVSR
jgi:hypothetical protein